MRRTFLVVCLAVCASAQLTVENYFFPVSVAPPESREEDSVYDEVGVENDVSGSIYPHVFKKRELKGNADDTHKMAKVFTKAKPDIVRYSVLLQRFPDISLLQTNQETSVLRPIIFAKPKAFVDDSGIEKAAQTNLKNVLFGKDPLMTISMSSQESSPTEKERGKTKWPNKSREFAAVNIGFEKTAINNTLQNVMADVARLRNEVNLIKGLVNKLYLRTYEPKVRARDDPKADAPKSMRISAVQRLDSSLRNHYAMVWAANKKYLNKDDIFV